MPLTNKGNKIMAAMRREYGPEKAKRVFYASANKGTITGVHASGGRTAPMPINRYGFERQTGKPWDRAAPYNEGKYDIRGPWEAQGATRVEPVAGFDKGFAMGGASHFGLAGMPWYARQEARSLGQVHSGPIVSSVPGRTDKHNMSVGSGSYIVPADVVSHIGQNNTQAGHAKLNQMFSGGPYGMHTMPLGKTHFANARPPRMSDAGGARGSDGSSDPVDIVTAGGEYTIPPETVARIGNGDVRLGHDILDAWVLKTRKEHIKTLQRLPGPAKS